MVLFDEEKMSEMKEKLTAPSGRFNLVEIDMLKPLYERYFGIGIFTTVEAIDRYVEEKKIVGSEMLKYYIYDDTCKVVKEYE